MKTDILVIAVNEIESRAICEAFQDATGKVPRPRSKGDRNYLNLGELNGTSVFMTICEMGSSRPGAAQQAVQDGINALNPSAIIGVGVAFGVNGKNRKVGDILVSRQLSLYEDTRVGTDQDGLQRTIARGDRAQASARLLNWLRTVQICRGKIDPPMQFGLMLSGEKLIDNRQFLGKLLEVEPEAIGGEMEGAGLYAACTTAKKDWIIIKSICDWADGKKGKKKRECQRLAARNAAQLLVFALENVPLPKRKSRIRRSLVPGWPFDEQTAKQRQSEVAKQLGLEVMREVKLPGDVKLTFMLIPHGEFVMGTQSLLELSKKNIILTPESELEQPAHRVMITRPFYLATTETTVAQFRSFADGKPYITEAEQQGFSIFPFPYSWRKLGGPPAALGLSPNRKFELLDYGWAKHLDASWRNTGSALRDNEPVVNVSWNDAMACCAWYSKILGYRFRLPTEAEWEYACRAGSNGLFYWGNSLQESHRFCNGADGALVKAINFQGEAFPGDTGILTVADVGSLRPNAWGLHDMIGNASEWCSDFFSSEKNYYRFKRTVNPQCMAGDRRIIRGGNWFRGPADCRCAARISRQPSGRSCLTGFRLVMEYMQPFDSSHDPKEEISGVYNLC